VDSETGSNRFVGETLVASDYQPFAEESSGVTAPDAASEATSRVAVNHSF